MRVLVIGSGGREQAIAWACRRHGHEVTLLPELRLFSAQPPDLVIPGPEAALVAGVADECARRGVACFGPTSELARLESSKGYARELATSLGIPGPRFARFEARAHGEAAAWFEQLGHPVVVKLDSLAGGKGVTVPESDGETFAAIGVTTEPFVLEELMTGPECSLIALCDGRTAVALPLAQDHKRIGEGDTGPNTGGMGAYAPAPVPYDVRRAAGDVRPADPRPLRLCRNTVRRRALRRPDAHRRGTAPRRVQRALRRPGGPGAAAAARRRPRGHRSRCDTRPHRRRRGGRPSGCRLHGRRRGGGLPRRAAAGRRGDAAGGRATGWRPAVPGRRARRRHQWRPRSRHHRSRRRPRRGP